MDKIVIELHCPSMGVITDMEIPLYLPFYNVVELINSIFHKNYYSDNNLILCDFNDGSIYNINKYTFELGLINGSKLLAI